MTPRHQRPTKLKTFLFGAPYYPEHWTEDDRKDDPARMAAAGVNVVRMAEFAWDLMEPARGKFDFSLFDETIARLGNVGINTILCTPTATPPRWLTVDHPDWMRVDADGRAMAHGSRQHACTTHPGFREESRRITRAMADHFRDNANVIGWQTDNELNCGFSECYCAACERAFRAWVKAKYKTVATLNSEWGTQFWSQTYAAFEHVPLPRLSRPSSPNPSHCLDYYRFISDETREFQRRQVEILREASAAWFITHNGIMGHIDYRKFTEDLDFLGVDTYPGFAMTGPQDAPLWSWIVERARAASGGFIVPEQQSGPGGQRNYFLANPPPGQMRLWAWQSVAHGADGILHFRWRTCRFGAEEYWCGVIDHDNIPRRRYEEFLHEGKEFAHIGPKLLHTTLDVEAAVLVDQDQAEAQASQPLGLPSAEQQEKLALGAMITRHLPCGLVDADDSLEGLKLAWVPSMPLMDEDLAAKLGAFVEAGGVLVMTARSATRRRNNQVFDVTPPGLLTDLFGVAVEEFGKIEPGSLSMKMETTRIPAGAGYEVLSAEGARQAAEWCAPDDHSPHAASGYPAVTVHRVGLGAAIYVGTFLSPANVHAIFDIVLHYAKVAPLATCDDHVEITRRREEDRRFVFVLNHYPHVKTVRGLPRGIDLITSLVCDGSVTVGPWGVAVIEEE